MSQLEKLLIKIRNNPKAVRFDEIDKILKNAGFEVRQPRGGSSHYIYTKGNFIISIPKHNPYSHYIYTKGNFIISIPKHNPYVKSVYVERVIEFLAKEGE